MKKPPAGPAATASPSMSDDGAGKRSNVFSPGGDIAQNFTMPTAERDYERREVMIPMRDGVKLFTVIVTPKGAVNAPIVLTRTPYNAAERSRRSYSTSMLAALPRPDEIFVKAGYIRVYQDVRGKYGSEGEYIVTWPVIGPLNDTGTDHVTDAYDTIDWLVEKANLPQSNGRVGMIGSSYEGFTVAMALLDPHPALKVAAPESPLIDGWMGDDWFNLGVFRLANVAYFGSQTSAKAKGEPSPTGPYYDDYDNFREAGSVGAWGQRAGYEQLPFWRRLMEHPAYDAYWQEHALDKRLAANPSNVPTLWEQGLWDQEDMYGAITSWESLKAAGKSGNNCLVMGPWFHSQVNREGYSYGPFKWRGDTVAQYNEEMVLPFFRQHLEDGPPANLAPVTIYNTGENCWEHFPTWPLAGEGDCPTPLTPLYLGADGGLEFKAGPTGDDSYVSDPAKPVPHLPRPIVLKDWGRWKDWLVTDQRFVDGRPDVLTYQTPPLTKAVRVSGAPIADLFATTTGTDGDFMVKLIDVYPGEYPSDPALGGYQLAISIAMLRGRYRASYENPSPIPSGRVQQYRFRLPTVNHVFLPGHRIMVQVQSTLFPAYDRNPQTYVPNIFFAETSDFQKATVTVARGGDVASCIRLPVAQHDQSSNPRKWTDR
jgi:putative CocE/NonD family hydrolase